MSALNKTQMIPTLHDDLEAAGRWNGYPVANAEPIPGYRLLEPLGKGGFGEVWKCQAPGGLPKAAKFVISDSDALQQQADLAEQEFAAFQYIKEIRHPFLLALDRVEFVGKTLVIIMELADQTLHDVFGLCRANGWPGIDRSTLLGYLREAAEALDTLNRRHHLQHLDVKPQNLFLSSEHVKVGDFGLVSSFSDNPLLKPSQGRLGRMTPLYMAPEMATASGFSRTTDQYSLAIVYQELLTGILPFDGRNPRQLLLQHTASEPNLQPLPPADRPIVARALAKKPEQRFGSCLEFVQALADQSSHAPVSVPARPARPVAEPGSLAESPSPRPSLPGHQFVKCLSRNDFSEDWLIQASDGRLRRAQVLQVREPAVRRSLAAGLQRLVGLEHPALPPFVVLPWDGERVALIANHTGQSLRERLAECRGEGLVGLTREEILGWLRRCTGPGRAETAIRPAAPAAQSRSPAPRRGAGLSGAVWPGGTAVVAGERAGGPVQCRLCAARAVCRHCQPERGPIQSGSDGVGVAHWLAAHPPGRTHEMQRQRRACGPGTVPGSRSTCPGPGSAFRSHQALSLLQRFRGRAPGGVGGDNPPPCPPLMRPGAWQRGWSLLSPRRPQPRTLIPRRSLLKVG